MKRILALFFLVTSLSVVANDKFTYYYHLSDSQSGDFSSEVVKPSQVLGYPIGDWHIRPDQSLAYFKALAQSSDKVHLQHIGKSYQQRPLIAVYISSPENIQKLEDYKKARTHLEDYKGPNIVYLGYSVHGNEASGANAAPLVAYRLAASGEKWIQDLLRDNIVIVDPMMNPDGMDRFANWVNRYKGRALVSDSVSIEHREAWPSGRTNHYWFDLNRDWLLLQHPESRARVELFYQWRPNIVGDFHEMGTNSTYFFQPGVKSRQNPLTSEENFNLTNDIAKFHAAALDDLGVDYYSKESFDDFYYGKGSTFPDINGGIGILFEQASSRGHIQESENGDLSFPFAIRNQVATSFSTLKAAQALKDELIQYQKDFFKQQQEKQRVDPSKAYVFTSQDKTLAQDFIALLKSHRIEVGQLTKSIKKNGKNYPAKSSYIVRLEQKQYGLIKTLFEQRTKFQDNTFYDVSAWTMPLAYNLQFTALSALEAAGLSETLEPVTKGRWLNLNEGDFSNAKNIIVKSHLSSVFSELNQLLLDDLDIKFTTKSFSLGSDNSLEFSPGDLVINISQSKDKKRLKRLLTKAFIDKGSDIYLSTTGFSNTGVDLGSPSIRRMKPVKPLLVIGSGVSSYEAGEVWHLLDQRLMIPVVMQSFHQMLLMDLDNYTDLLMVSGEYPELSKEAKKKLQKWLQKGGNLIASKGAVSWLVRNELVAAKLHNRSHESQATPSHAKESQRHFDERSKAYAEAYIGGAIFDIDLDLTHPISFGLDRSRISMTKSGVQILAPKKNRFMPVGTYSRKPLAAGYSSQENINKIANTPAILVEPVGRGSIVMFNDNPNFRAYWKGSSRLYTNALFYKAAF